MSALGCNPLGLEYDFTLKSGRLDLPEGECCDMDGCIKLFIAIDPAVNHIETRSGKTPDTTYRLHRGDWLADWPR